MRRLPLLALVLPLFPLGLFAQTTWHGLEFGQPRDAVRAQLSSQSIASDVSQDGTLKSTGDYLLPIPGLSQPFPMLANFYFDASSKLSTITLLVDIPGMRHDWSALGGDEALATFAAEKLTGALSGKYGAPLYRSSVCDSQLTAPAAFCIVSWRGPDQTIELERASTPRGPRIIVRYQPLATDL
jgi:hypothetical protein